MKKNRFALMGVLVALTTGLLLASCGESTESTSQSSSSSGGEDVVVPVVEGKVSFAFHLASTSVEFKSYNSIFLTGSMTEKVVDDAWKTDWATGLDAIEMVNIEGTDVYYGQYAWDAAAYEGTQAKQYQLVAGYNESAEVAANLKGLQWVDSYKSAECAAYAYPLNPEWVEDATQANVVWLNTTTNGSTHTFNAQPPAPKILHNYKIIFEFEDEIPDYVGGVYMTGTFNSWSEDLAVTKLTQVEGNKKQFFKVFDEILADTIEFQIVVEYPEATKITWSYKVAENNMTYSVLAADGDNFVSDPQLLGVSFADLIPDPDAAVDFVFTLTNTGGALAETVTTLYINGSFLGWTAAALTKVSADEFTFTKTMAPQAIEFGFMSNTDWSDKAVAEGGGNLMLTLVADKLAIGVTADFSKFGVSAQTAVVTY
jgi:hypothetical protein